VRNGADVTIQTNDGFTALHLFVTHNYETNGFLDIYDYLDLFDKLTGPQKSIVHTKTSQGDVPLHLACRSNALINTTLLLQAGANPNVCNFSNNTALHFAVTCKNIPIVRVLLEAGADAMQRNQQGTCLDVAKTLSCPELVSLLKDLTRANNHNNYSNN